MLITFKFLNKTISSLIKPLRYFAVVLLSFSVILLANAEKYPESKVEMTLKKVSEHVYYVQGKAGIATDNEGFISNSIAIITTKGIVVVDALGSPSLAQLFLKKLAEVSQQPVVKVIMTHYHADHIYGLQLYKALGAEIIAPQGYQKYFDSQGAKDRLVERQFSLAPYVNESTHLVPADRVINKNTQFSLGGIDFQLNYLGKAHSDGDLSLLVKPDNVLITGDLIFEGRVPFTGNADTKNWLALLQSLESTNLTALIPGHGAAANNPDKAIQLTRHYLQYVREVMIAAVDDFLSFDEAYEQADWSEFEDLPAFNAANRNNAYGVFLSVEQEALNQ